MKRHLLATIAGCSCAVASLLVAAPPVNAVEYADNGGFEAGTAGWFASGGTLAIADAAAVAPASGAASGKLTLLGGPATLRQATDAALPPGAYHASIAVRAAAATVPVVLRVTTTDAHAGVAQQSGSAAAGAWTVISLDLTTAGVSDLTLGVTVQGSTGTVVYFDDAHLDGPAAGSTTPAPTATDVAPTAEAEGSPTSTPSPSPTLTPTPSATPDDYVGDLRNGGFEEIDGTGAIAAWHRIGGAMSAASAPVRSGSRAARFESDSGSTKWLYQTVAVTAGDWYEFSAWLLDDDAAVSSSFLRISWYASADGSGSALGTADSDTRLDAPAGGYRLLTTGAVEAPSGARSARVRVMLAPVSSAPAAIYVDDAAFVSTSPATATAVAAAGDSTNDGSADSGTGAASANGGTAARRAKKISNVAAAARAPRAAGARVVINEVLYDPDADAADAAAEWVELYNGGDADQSLAEWTLSDAAATDTLPDVTVRARSFAILAASDSFLDAYPQYDGPVATLGGRIGNSLGNDGDALVLKDPSGVAVDAISWGSDASVLRPAIADVPEGHSIERQVAGGDSDRAQDFVDNREPSPGRPYAPPGSNSQPQAGAPKPVPLLASGRSGVVRWLPWALVAASSVALALVLGWRALPAVRGRLHRAQ